MRKHLFLLIFILQFTISIGQSKEGALRTDAGLLLYSNQGHNTYTMYLPGDVNISLYPIIKQDSILFQFFTADTSHFGTVPNQILRKYMDLETKYINLEFENKVPIKNKYFDYKKHKANIWYYTQKISPKATFEKRKYYLDFIKNDKIYRFNYVVKSSEHANAIKTLIKLANCIEFHENDVNVNSIIASLKNRKP